MFPRLTIDEAHRVTKAFAIYFELTNLAETNHRKRRRRAAKLHPEQPPLEGSFRGTFRRMRAAGIDARQALEVLRKIKVVPVFTAHPTEVARRTVLLKRRRIGKQLERLDRLPLTEADAGRFEALIFGEVTSLWQTDEVRLEKPLVTDEIRMGLDHYPFPCLPPCRVSMTKWSIPCARFMKSICRTPKCPICSFLARGSAATVTATRSSRPAPPGKLCSGREM